MLSLTYTLIAALLMTVSAMAADATNRDDQLEPRASEVREIVANILEIHPEGPRLRRDPMFTEAASALQDSADTLELPEYIMRLHHLFSLVGDGHTAVLSTNLPAEPFALRTPILVEPFADGLYVVEARDEARPLHGHRVTKVNGFPVEEILAAYIDSAPGDNPAFALRWSPFLFAFPGWIAGLGFASGTSDAPIAIEVVTGSGEAVGVELRPRVGANVGREQLKRRKSRVEEMLEEEGVPNFVRTLHEEKALFVSIDAMEDTERKSFIEFTAEVRRALAHADIDRVIIDLRRNGGGNNMLCEPLRRSLVKSRFNRPGGIFVLTGRRTFSAAMNFATRLERETDALFVGEPTGGRPNHYGDARMLTGPTTGVPYLVSTLRWADSTPFDNRIWLLPDIPAPARFRDYVAGRDAALQAALSHSSAQTETDDDRATSPWARESQQAGWRFFFQPGSEGISGPVK